MSGGGSAMRVFCSQCVRARAVVCVLPNHIPEKLVSESVPFRRYPSVLLNVSGVRGPGSKQEKKKQYQATQRKQHAEDLQQTELIQVHDGNKDIFADTDEDQKVIAYHPTYATFLKTDCLQFEKWKTLEYWLIFNHD